MGHENGESAADGVEAAGEEFMTLNVRLCDGRHFACEAASGFHLVELIRAYGVPIKAECGGAGACATCHIKVADAWAEKLPSPGDEEQDKLDEILGADDHSRLACQIVMKDELDGLEIELQDDSLLDDALKATG